MTSPETVAGKDVIFLTTNGTKALAAAHEADQVIVGCLRNAPSVARYLDSLECESVYLVCAGSRGVFSYEDFAGAAEIISHMNPDGYRMSDAAILAREFSEKHGHDPLRTITTGRVGRMFGDRIPEVCRFTAEVGASRTVPELKDEYLHLTGKVGEAKVP